MTSCGWRILGALIATMALQSLAWPATAAPRIFVMPLEVELPTKRTYWAGEGAAILIADELQALGADAVTRELRVSAYERLRLPLNGTLTRATMIRVAEAAGATDVVLGRVSLDDRSLTLSARLLDLDAGGYRPDLVERGAPQDLFVIARRLAKRVLLDVMGGVEPAAAGSPPTPSPALEAFESYVKGLLDERPEARLKLFKAALARQPDLDRARLAIWKVHSETGDHQAALAAVKSVAATSARSREARFLAALSLLELRQYDEAFLTLKALGDERASAAVYNNIAVVLIRRGATPQTGRPAYYLSKAADLSPDDPDIVFNLGYAYWADRDAKGAIYWLREAVRRSPLDADAHLVLGAALTATGAGVEAGRERELAGRLSSRYEDWERRGNAADHVPRGLERVMDAERVLHGPTFDAAITAAAQRDSREMAAFYLERGRRFFEQQRDDDAVAELRRALYLSPYDAEAHLLLGRTLLRAGHAEDAITALRVSVWSQDSAAARLALAEALEATKNPGLARAEAMRALALDPSLQAARVLIARLDERTPKP
jgi:tetratricopeptide (TPR) repeat protein